MAGVPPASRDVSITGLSGWIMCTVTFIPRRNGYCLGMNRDENLARRIALPPTQKKMRGGVVICPAEPGGGTWIALNDQRVCLALINWHAIPERVGLKSVSRGKVIQAAWLAGEPDSVAAALDGLPLRQINPFRLIGIFPAGAVIVEWRWDLKQLAMKCHRWKAQQWISSGFDEPTAQCVRGKIFQQAQRQRSAGSVDWLRRLHRSHLPQTGPFSTCMHRADAATVSHTEITVSAHQAKMRYHAGAPCQLRKRCRTKKISTKGQLTHAEYNSTGPGANPESRFEWAKHLTKEEAEKITLQTVLGGNDAWESPKVNQPPSTRNHGSHKFMT